MNWIGIVKYAVVAGLLAACSGGDADYIRYGNSGGGGPASGVGGSAGFGGSSGPSGFAGKGGGPVDVGTFAEAVEESDPAPPPIAGGTLAIIAQGTKAAVSDPDNDQVVVIDLESMKVTAAIPLALGDDPGRIVEDTAGHLHVSLRGGRGIAVVDPVAGVSVARLPICLLPRGLAYDAFADTVHVACGGGELVSYYASNGMKSRKLKLDRDLRDVVIDGEKLLVSRFRAAELLVVEGDGSVSDRLTPSSNLSGIQHASVAWRTIPAPGGGALMVHQVISTSPIDINSGGYGGQCRKIVTSAVSWLRTDHSGWMVDSIPVVLPVDVATTSDQTRVVVPSAGRSASMNFNGSAPWALFNAPGLGSRISLAPCGTSFPSAPYVGGQPNPTGRVVAVGFDPPGRLAMQTRGPNVFHLGDRQVPLPGRVRKHTGHELFHVATAGGIACASCHPEGRDDGQVWNFSGIGPRRTQSLSGGIAGTEPFHWSGDMNNFQKLAADVMGSRMSGPHMQWTHVDSLEHWINTIPRLPAPDGIDPNAAARGQALFNDPTVGCISCHNGARMTNNTSVWVTTGGTFQVPSLLGVAWRAPYMHTGCAATLQDRFGATSCGGGDGHGQTSQLTTEQVADLVAYMETL